jgi:hypothetical protein
MSGEIPINNPYTITTSTGGSDYWTINILPFTLPTTTVTTTSWPVYPTIQDWPEGLMPVAGAIVFDRETNTIKVFDGKEWCEIKDRTNEPKVSENIEGVLMSEIDKIKKEIYG